MKTTIDRIIERLDGMAPRTALILGSGLGGLVDSIDNPVRFSYADLDGFPASRVSGHAGELVAGTLSGRPVFVLSGRSHYYENGNASAMRPAIETLKNLGVERLILTNSAGSLRDDLVPGSVMMITDHINFSGTNPLIGEETDSRFVGMTSAYDQTICKQIETAANAAGVRLNKGVYMWFSGPSFETPAEIRMARILGADAVGMSTVPEVIIGRFLGLKCAACSVITNYGAGMTGAELSHEETKEMAPIGGKRLQTVLAKAIGSME